VNTHYYWTHHDDVPFLCLVCQSMLSNGPFVELLVNQKYINIYIYAGITHILRKWTGQTVLAAGSVRAMERDKHIKPLREFESRIFEPVD